MIEVIGESKPVARKRYACDACVFLREVIGDAEFSISEYRQIVKAKRNGWCIVPGQSYIKQFNRNNGEIYTVRAIPEIHELCLKHDIYPDDI